MNFFNDLVDFWRGKITRDCVLRVCLSLCCVRVIGCVQVWVCDFILVSFVSVVSVSCEY